MVGGASNRCMFLFVAGLLMFMVSQASARKLLIPSGQDGEKDSTGLNIEHGSAPAPAKSVEDEKNFIAYGGMGHYSGIGGFVGVGGLPIMPGGLGGVGGLGGLGGGIAKGGAIGGGVGVVPHP